MQHKKCILIATLMSLIFSSPNYAQQLLVGGGGYYILKNPTIQNGFGYQVNFAVKTQQRIAMLTSIGHYQEPTHDRQFASAVAFPISIEDIAATNNYLLDGDFALTYFELSPIVDLLEIKSLQATLCIGAGMGLYYAHNKWTKNTYHSLFLSQEQDSIFYNEGGISPHFGVNFRAALTIPATSKSFVSVEAKYVYYKPEIRSEISITKLSESYIRNREIDLSTLSINVSLMLIL